MFDAPAARLAVARLMETGEAGQACRHRRDRQVEGYCLVSGDEQNCRVTIYVENGRTLTDRSGRDAFYYEGWLLTDRLPVSAGAFNTGPAGGGSATCEPDLAALERATGIRVTAEPFGGSGVGHTPVLEGSLIWLQGRPGPPAAESAALEPAPAAMPPGVAAAEPATEPEAERVPVLQAAAGGGAPWSGLLAGAGAPISTMPAASPGPVAQGEEPRGDREPEPEPEPRQERQPEPAAPGGPPPGETAPGFKLYPEPATMVTKVTPLTLNVPLASQHPMAPRAVGAAVLHLRDGRINLTLRSLPSPAALGRDPATDRPFNAYRVWLLNERTGQALAVGLCERLWGEHYRFQSEPGLQLTRHDALLVTVGDRNDFAPSPDSARVMLGTYPPT